MHVLKQRLALNSPYKFSLAYGETTTMMTPYAVSLGGRVLRILVTVCGLLSPVIVIALGIFYLENVTNYFTTIHTIFRWRASNFALNNP